MSSSQDPQSSQVLPYDGYYCFQSTLTPLMFEILFYGIYTVIFGLYIYLEARQRGRNRFYQICLLILYILGSTTLALSISNLRPTGLVCFSGWPKSSSPNLFREETFLSERLTLAAQGIYAAANTIAETLILYRCYIIWGSRKRIVAGPIILCVINTGGMIAAVVFQQTSLSKQRITQSGKTFVATTDDPLSAAGLSLYLAFMVTNFFSNLLLTGLIAGRIYQLSRITRKSLGYNKSDKRGSSAFAMILESGLIYPIALIPCTINQTSNANYFLEALLTIILGLASTLIIVRVNLQLSTITSNTANTSNYITSNTTNTPSQAANYTTQPSDLERQPLSDVQPPSQSSNSLQPFPFLNQQDPGQQIPLTSNSRMINPLPRKYQSDSQRGVIQQNIRLGGSRKAK